MFILHSIMLKSGAKFTVRIDGVETQGKIQIQGTNVYLCQDTNNGCNCRDKLGYKYSWLILENLSIENLSLSDDNLKNAGVSKFKFVSDRKSRIEKLNI